MSRKQHISRMAVPSTWPTERKGTKWIAKPMPGPHNLRYSMAQLVVLRDILKIAETARDIKRIINQGLILINGTIRKELNFPVGLFDVIVIPKMGKFYRMVLTQKCQLMLIEISEEDANLIPLKVANKMAVKGKKIQLSFNNGWTMFTDNKEIKCGDTVVLDFNKKSIAAHIKLQAGNTVYTVGGNHAGRIATLKDIKELGEFRKRKIASLSTANKEDFETALEHVFTVGETKPEIKLI